MKQQLATLIGSVNDAQRRVRDSTRQTPEWRDAQRAAVQARVDYWNAMCLTWDVRHSRAVATGESPATADLAALPGVGTMASPRWVPASRLAQIAADQARSRRGSPPRTGRRVVRSALA